MGRKGRKHKAERGTEAICVYCGAMTSTTKEHVIPKCLFPEGQPLPSDMITVPVCGPCNQGKDDDYLRDLLVSDIDARSSPIARSLFMGKVLRSVGRNRSDFGRSARSAGRMRARHSIGGIYLGDYPTIPIEPKRVNRVLTLIVSGLCYKTRRQRLPSGCVSRFYRIDSFRIPELLKEFRCLGCDGPHLIGDGRVFDYRYLASEADPTPSAWLLRFYERVVYAVTLLPPNGQAG